MSTLYNSRIARRTTPLPTSETHRMGDVVMGFATYTYDGKGNVIGDGTTTYEYDALNRLVKETKGTAVSNYTYDGNGRISNFAGKACTYDNRGRLTKIGSTTLTYDNYGNRLSKGSTNYTWTRGRLLSGVGSNTFEYDYSGIRSKKNDIEYYYNGNKLLAEKRGDKTIQYLYDDSGICGFRYNGAEYEFVKNIFGDVISIHYYGVRIGLYEYDAWGNCTVKVNYMGDIVNLNPIRYRGYYYDTETKLYYLQNRYYDPEVGQFISPDTFDYLEPETIGGVDLYAYCLNNPVTYSDPSGHSIIGFLIGLAIGSFITWGASQIFGAQIVGGTSSIIGGVSAIYTGASLLAFGPIGWIAGTALIFIGGGTALFGVNEVVDGITGTNYIQEWTGMSDALYNGLYIGLNIASSIGTIAGNAFMRYANVNIYGNRIGPTEGAKPFQRYTLIDNQGIKQYRYFNSKGKAWFDLDFRHGGVKHRFPHYNVWDANNRSSIDRSFWMLIKWLFTGR